MRQIAGRIFNIGLGGQTLRSFQCSGDRIVAWIVAQARREAAEQLFHLSAVRGRGFRGGTGMSGWLLVFIHKNNPEMRTD